MAAGDDTKAFESAQALFCAMADYLGTQGAKKELNYTTHKTYEAFKSKNEKLITDAFSKIKTTGVSLDLIESVLIKDVGWYKSSINIAVKLIEDIKQIDSDFAKIQTKGWTTFFYYRGAAGGTAVMEDIETLFKIANKKEKLFGDINKWSPADIYFASKIAEKKIQKIVSKPPQGFNFVNLNELMNDLIDAGELLGVSLKKSPKEVTISKINFKPDINQEILNKVKYFGMSDKDKGTDRDFVIYFGASKSKPFIKIRHDPHSESLGATLSVKVEIEGKNSRLGSLASFGTGTKSATGFTDLWARTNPTYASKVATSFQTGARNYKTAIDILNKKYKEKAKTQKNGAQLKAELKIKKLYEEYKEERILLSVKHIVGSFDKLIREYFTSSTRDQIEKDNVILDIYKYVSAMSPSSGKFVIVK